MQIFNRPLYRRLLPLPRQRHLLGWWVSSVPFLAFFSFFVVVFVALVLHLVLIADTQMSLLVPKLVLSSLVSCLLKYVVFSVSVLLALDSSPGQSHA